MIRLLSLFIIATLMTSCAPATVSRTHPYTSIVSTQGQYVYVVKSGDTLWRISRKFGVGVEDIRKANKMRSVSSLKVGQKLVIPFYRRSFSGGADFVWPVNGEIVNFFGEEINDSINNGINIKTNPNESVRSAADGEVIFCNYLKGWGQTIILEHPNRFYTIYANLATVTTKEGSRINKNVAIGKVAPADKGDYVFHFEIRKNYVPQDPVRYLR